MALSPGMTPLAQFDRTIKRADAVVSLHRRTYAAKGRPPQEWSDVLRGTLMLTVGALDALVDDLLVERLPIAILRGRQGFSVLKWVKDSPDRALQALSASTPQAELAKWVEHIHEKDSFVQPWVIEGALENELGCPLGANNNAKEPWARMSTLMSTFGATWTPQQCRAIHESVVRRRNQIAHDGDVHGSGKTNSIRRTEVEVAILATACLGHSINAVILAHVP